MALRFRTVERRPVVAVNGQHGSFEPVAGETEISQPADVPRNRFESDEKSRQEEQGDGAGRGEERSHLDVEGGAKKETEPLSHQRQPDHHCQQEAEAFKAHRLVGHQVNGD